MPVFYVVEMKFKIFIVSLVIAQSLQASLLVNPNFEDQDMSAWTREAISGIRPWSIGSATPQSGSRYVFTVDEAKISQTFASVSVDAIEEFSFWVDRPATATLLIEVFYQDGESSGIIDISSATDAGWNKYEAKTLLVQQKNLTGIQITKLGSGTVRLDNFRLTKEGPSVQISADRGFVTIDFTGILQHSDNLKDWDDLLGILLSVLNEFCFFLRHRLITSGKDCEE